MTEFPEGGAPVRISHRLCPSSSRRPGILADRRAARVVVVAYAPQTGEKVDEKEGEKREKSIYSTSRTLRPFHNCELGFGDRDIVQSPSQSSSQVDFIQCV